MHAWERSLLHSHDGLPAGRNPTAGVSGAPSRRGPPPPCLTAQAGPPAAPGRATRVLRWAAPHTQHVSGPPVFAWGRPPCPRARVPSAVEGPSGCPTLGTLRTEHRVLHLGVNGIPNRGAADAGIHVGGPRGSSASTHVRGAPSQGASVGTRPHPPAARAARLRTSGTQAVPCRATPPGVGHGWVALEIRGALPPRLWGGEALPASGWCTPAAPLRGPSGEPAASPSSLPARGHCPWS